jgi:hypothetical protein
MLTELEELNRIAALAMGPESEAGADILPVAPPSGGGQYLPVSGRDRGDFMIYFIGG